MQDAMMGALINYVNLIKPLARNVAGQKGTVSPTAFIGQATKEGWMSAGRYYWDLLRIESAYDNNDAAGNYQRYLPTNIKAPTLNLDPVSQDGTVNSMLSKTPAWIGNVNTSMDAVNGAASSGQTGAAIPMDQGGMSWLMVIVSTFTGSLTGLLMMFDSSGNSGAIGIGMGPEPILWLHNLGMFCLSLGAEIWLGVAIAMFPILLAANICRVSNPLGPAIKGVLDWVNPYS